MHRSDRIYLSKFELDPNPEYLNFDDLDLDYQSIIDEFYDESIPDDEKNFVNSNKEIMVK
jgi:hypothetical protein